MDCDCDLCSEQSWWDWLQDEPGLYFTFWSLGMVLMIFIALYLLISGN
jgi:hypothetical protein